tara:strand:+ start:3900 stop:4025 length:126 start_codon:yes stop_codon:yes gene_type:complete
MKQNMNCFYCKSEYGEDQLIEFVAHELGCEECIEELYGGLL